MTTDSKRILSPRERRQRNREEMIQSILDVARDIMREHGVAALNLNEVARRVGVKTPSLYEYFAGKSALYDELFRLGLHLYSENADRAMEGVQGGREQLRIAIEAYMSFAQKYPELWALVFERPVPGFVPSVHSMAESRERLALASRYMEEAMERGEIVPGVSPEQARDFVIAVMHGLAASHMANEPELPVGSGRFGSLIPVAMQVLEAAWMPHKSERKDEA
jgi:AcrR family transcriptional regulator